MNSIIESLCILALAACVAGCSAPPPRSPLQEQSSRHRRAEELIRDAVSFTRKDTVEALAHAHYGLILAAELVPGDARIPDGLGCIAWRRRDYPAAEAFFRRAIKLDPAYAGGYAHLALIAERKGKAAEAKRLFEKALSLAPLDYQTRNNYAVFLAFTAADSKALQASYAELQKAQRSRYEDDPLIAENSRILRGSIRMNRPASR